MHRICLMPLLAARSMLHNARTCLPHLVACTVVVALHYDIQFLNTCHALDQLPGVSSLRGLLSVVVLALDLFSALLVFYTNGHLMRHRLRELGLYSVLGMERRHIRSLLRWEWAYTTLVSIGGGLALGIALSRLFLRGLGSLLQADVGAGLEIPQVAVLFTVFVYACILTLSLVANLARVSVARPIELLRASAAAEREPATRWLTAAVGVVALACGYGLSLLTNPLLDLGVFLAAVLLVILATRCLFSAGSVAALKALRADRDYYYRPNHIVALSSMLHRMRRNAAGLATICVLVTMALVMTSTTLCLYVCAASITAASDEPGLKTLLASYFFVGLFLSALFLMASLLIVYYRQLTEGDEDARTYEVLRKLGMSADQVASASRYQALLAFLPPLVVAAVHTAAALPMTYRILMAFGLSDPWVLLACYAATVAVFGLVYLVSCKLATRRA